MPRILGPALAVLALALGAPTAEATTSVSVHSDPNDFLGGGQTDLFGPGARIATGSDGLVSGDHVVVSAYDPAQGGWELTFAAPEGERLEARNYVDAQRAVFRESGHPGLSAVADSQRACNSVYGRFEVRDIVRREDGTVRRLWVVFQLHCEGKVPATWGEVRINVDGPPTVPSIVRWPELDAWQTATTVPVAYEGGAPLAGTSVSGAGFSADDGGCRATRCTVLVAFQPSAAGAMSGTLRLTDAAGGVQDVSLEGFRHGGTTRVEIDELLTPRSFRHEPPGARFSGFHYDTGLATVYVQDGSTWWQGRFWPGSAGWVAGRTYGDTSVGSGGAERPAMDVIGSGDVCNAASGGTFTLNSISREPDGGLRTLDISFEQPCYEGDQRRPALRGRWRYRAGDDSAFADWLVPGPRPGLPPMAPEGGTDGTAAVDGPAAGNGTTTTTGAPPVQPASPPAPRPLTASAAQAAVRACARGGRRTRTGTARGELLRGTVGGDRLVGRGGRDRLVGRGGDDCLHGGDGSDRIDAGPGRDALFGGKGDDVLVGGPGADVLDCGRGRRDRAVAGRGDRVRGCERVVRPPR